MEAQKRIHADLRGVLESLTQDQLKECYGRAQSNSFLIIRERSMGQSSLFEQRLLTDIGDAFHNYREREPNNELYIFEMVTDLLFYEEWIKTIQVLAENKYIEHTSLILYLDRYSLLNIMAKV